MCNKLIYGGLTGTANPYWKEGKYPGSSVDGVTGASTQGNEDNVGLSVTRSLDIGNVRKFRVCFEIDRSWNSTVNFNDRPAFTYRSATIDLDDLQTHYDLSLHGWMSNDTGPASSSLCQWPKAGITIPDWDIGEFMTDVSWLAPYDDMVSTLRIVVEEN